MGKVVNLNKYRERCAREARAKRAAEARAQSGLTKTERTTRRRQAVRHKAALDGKKLDKSTDRPPEVG